MNNIYIPQLPTDALPKDAERKAGQSVTPWLDDWMAYCKERVVTPAVFMRSAAFWLIGTATARRAVLIPAEQSAIYNTHYIWWVAPTTYYKKSTGLYVVRKVAEAFDHLLLPDNATPEVLKAIMSGQDTRNQAVLDREFQERHTESKEFAAQRGWMVDEASGLFEKDYQTGIVSLLLHFDNNPDKVITQTLSRGANVIRRIGLNTLFVDTPTAVSRTFSASSWHDGLFARFAFITPGDVKVNLNPTRLLTKHEQTRVPSNIVDPLIKIAKGEIFNAPAHAPAIMTASQHALDLYDEYKLAVHALTHTSSELDLRLFGTYGRLPMHLLRLAMSLTLIDRASGEHQSLEITVGHMARAIEVVEEWRHSAHEMLYHINRGPDAMHHDSVIRFMRRDTRRKTMMEIKEGANLPSVKVTSNTIKDLLDEGTVLKVESGGKSGYLLATSNGTSGKYDSFINH